MKVDYKKLELGEIYLLSNLWQKLIYHLLDNSERHKDYFEKRKFNERIKPFIEKVHNGEYLIEVAYDVDTNEDIGYCFSSINEQKVGEIDSIYIDKRYRGLSIGDYFMRSALHFFETYNADKMVLSVSEGNERVMSFYKKYGFEVGAYTLEKMK